MDKESFQNPYKKGTIKVGEQIIKYEVNFVIVLDNFTLSIKDEVIHNRRSLHQIPESGFEEYKTGEFIISKLKEYDIEYFPNIAGTGVLGYMKGFEGKRTIAFRSEMDALSVEEKTGLSYSSKNKGMMHACGHDGHMAILLGLAFYLSKHKEKLRDHVVFVFQPAEEGPGGAKFMIEQDIIEKFKIDRIYGLHLYPDVLEGMLGCKHGPMMAQTAEFDMVIRGQSGHGAIPHKAKDSVVAAASLISAFQSIISRSIEPIEGAVITVGKMWAGERRNVIAGTANLEGTIRAFNEKVYNTIKDRMKEITKGIELMYSCSIDLEFRDMYPAVINDVEMFKEFVEAIGDDNIELVDPQMTAEDFSYFQKVVPGLFFFVGVRNKEKGYKYPLHHCNFDFDEDVLLVGIQTYIEILKHIKAL